MIKNDILWQLEPPDTPVIPPSLKRQSFLSKNTILSKEEPNIPPL